MIASGAVEGGGAGQLVGAVEGGGTGQLVGAVEGGGTKFVMAVGSSANDIQERVRIETRTPAEMLPEIVAFFEGRGVQALGLAMFGPVELEGPSAGTTLKTPKQGWDGVPVGPHLTQALGVPVRTETDVNAAALAEATLGAAQGLKNVVYLTVGTGIGGGVLVDGKPMHGLMHSELGHMRIPRVRGADGQLDTFEGSCRFHGFCFEGVASGSALCARLGVADLKSLPNDHPVWTLEARYLAMGIANITLCLSPERVVLGGGVLKVKGLRQKVRTELVDALGGYLPSDKLCGDKVDTYLCAPTFEDSGLMGAFLLANQAIPR